MPLIKTLQVNMLEMVLRSNDAGSKAQWFSNLSFLEKTIESNPSFIPTTSNWRLKGDKLFPQMG